MNNIKATHTELIICAICGVQAFAGDHDPDLQGHICKACVPDAAAASSALYAAGFRACSHNPQHEL